jgi:hypothetical protein
MEKIGTIFLSLLMLSANCIAGELPDTIFGIKLLSNIDNLKGKNTRQIGIVTIKGIKHERYVMDKAVYTAVLPLEEVMVSVEMKSRKIISIGGFVEIEPEECQIGANALKEQAEKSYSIEFSVLKHQGDSFYIYETKDKFISIGCQDKRKTMLQYQLGGKSS